MAKILVTGLNPAWQQIFTLPALRVGEVNRAAGYVELASGKGMNVAKILAGQGHQVTLLQVLAGKNGEAIFSACQGLGIRSLHVMSSGDTRVCATLLHGGETTEVIAPFTLNGEELEGEELAGGSIAESLLATLIEEQFDALLICGSLPSGLEETIYGRLAHKVNAPLLIWDSVAGLTATLMSRITWLKVNSEEYARLSAHLGEIPSHISQLVTDGPKPARVILPTRSAFESAFCHVPRLASIVNPIGAGDTVTAMLADGILRGLEPRTAVARALSAAAASCLNVLPAVWNPEDQERLEREVYWSELGAS